MENTNLKNRTAYSYVERMSNPNFDELITIKEKLIRLIKIGE